MSPGSASGGWLPGIDAETAQIVADALAAPAEGPASARLRRVEQERDLARAELATARAELERLRGGSTRPELTDTALLAHVHARHVLEHEDDSKAYLHIPGRDPIDVTVQIWAWLADGWVWLPPDTLVWHLTDAGRTALEEGAP